MTAIDKLQQIVETLEIYQRQPEDHFRLDTALVAAKEALSMLNECTTCRSVFTGAYCPGCFAWSPKSRKKLEGVH